MIKDTDTICAIATPPGKGSVSIIRISGNNSKKILKQVINKIPEPRSSHYGKFYNSKNEIIDSGITLYFKSPNSFTGEDIVEFQAHGGPVVVDILLNEIIQLGARLARPGEFSERAFINNKIDLIQAEAIADLINSNTTQAAKYAQRSLQGDFSKLIKKLVTSIIEIRIFLEAAIDFPDEEIDYLSSGKTKQKIQLIQEELYQIKRQAKQGSIIKEGIKIVLAGSPNTGKSSLLNVLAGYSSAIVTNIAGTTRDTLREHINIDGIPVHVIDTAGIRDSEDVVEREGIRRAWQEIQSSDLILLLEEANMNSDIEENYIWKQLKTENFNVNNLLIVKNKIDITGQSSKIEKSSLTGLSTIYLSATKDIGIDLLRKYIKQHAGFELTQEGGFIARRRHLDSLDRAQSALTIALEQLVTHNAIELVAEDLREVQNCLNEITGEFTSDDLLGEIFSNFCLGK